MKKLTLIILVAMVPFFTIAQKRGKKDKKQTTTNTSYEFMIITGKSKAFNQPTASGVENPVVPTNRGKKMKISFDFGGLEPSIVLRETIYRSMAHAVNIASQEGWEFINANVVNSGPFTVHHYYMRRNK